MGGIATRGVWGFAGVTGHPALYAYMRIRISYKKIPNFLRVKTAPITRITPRRAAPGVRRHATTAPSPRKSTTHDGSGRVETRAAKYELDGQPTRTVPTCPKGRTLSPLGSFETGSERFPARTTDNRGAREQPREHGCSHPAGLPGLCGPGAPGPFWRVRLPWATVAGRTDDRTTTGSTGVQLRKL